MDAPRERIRQQPAGPAGARPGAAPARRFAPATGTDGALPHQRFAEWPKILQAFREALKSALGKDPQAMAKLQADGAFSEFVSALAAERRAEFSIKESDFAALRYHLRADAFGYGPLQVWLDDPEVEDIMVDSFRQVHIRRGGQFEPAASPFSSDGEIISYLNTKVFQAQAKGQDKEFNRSNPAENGQLRDGTRVFAWMPPIAPHAGFTFRKHKPDLFQSAEEYIATGIAPVELFAEIQEWLAQGRSLIISGATGSGKTTFTNFVASLIAPSKRIVTLEDTPELNIKHPHLSAYFTVGKAARAGQQDDKDITMQSLVKMGLRLSPDWLIIGEVRGMEALDMLKGMNTGHPGITTLHAGSPLDAITRIEGMAMESDDSPSESSIQRNIAQTVDIVVQIRKLDDGRRVVTSVEQVLFPPRYESGDDLRDGGRELYPGRLIMRRLWGTGPDGRLQRLRGLAGGEVR